MLESVEVNRILMQIEHVLQDQLRASERRQKFFEAACVVQSSAHALVKLLTSALDKHYNEQQVIGVRNGLNALDKDCCILASQSDEHHDMDMQLGAKQSDLSKKLIRLKPVIEAISSSLGVKSTVIASRASNPRGRSDESDSSIESESLPVELTSYFQSVARAKTLQDQIDDATAEHSEILSTQQPSHGTQYRSAEHTLHTLPQQGDHLSQKREELIAAHQESLRLREVCRENGINVNEARWRDENQHRRRTGLRENDAARLRGWLSEVPEMKSARVREDEETMNESAFKISQMIIFC